MPIKSLTYPKELFTKRDVIQEKSDMKDPNLWGLKEDADNYELVFNGV